MTVELIDQTPCSNIYQDIYFSRENGLAESRHVFLKGNSLPQRWTGKPGFTIGETGFGTGLNFLATWQAWRQHATTNSRLHFISVEKHPLNVKTLESCHELFPELDRLSDELCRTWPGPLSGMHRCFLDSGRVTLTLCHGEAGQVLKELVAEVDCWYLDGFSPAKNPDMWNRPVFREIARMSTPGTTFATFTAAAAVQHQLLVHGFEIRKVPGFGQKREMLTGRMKSRPNIRMKEPWYFPAPPRYASKTATVIGAGIAGAQTAYHLANRGWKVTVLEKHSSPAQGASGSPAAVFSPFLTARPSLEEMLSLQSFAFLLNHLGELDPEGAFHNCCGILDLAIAKTQLLRHEKIMARPFPEWLVRPATREQTRLAGTTAGGLFMPHAGFLNPRKWIEHLLLHPNIKLRLDSKVYAIETDSEGFDTIGLNDQTLSHSPVLILATGHSMTWDETRWIPCTTVSGQSTFIDVSLLNQSPRYIIRYGGCLLPAAHGRHLIGSTFECGECTVHPNPASNQHNLNNLKRALPHLLNPARKSDHRIKTAHNGVRTISEDRFPVVGSLPKRSSFCDQFQNMHSRSSPLSKIASAYCPGLYVSAAWGSRGMTQAALGGEFLASMICHEPLPLQTPLIQAIHPARSLVRSLKRKKL